MLPPAPKLLFRSARGSCTLPPPLPLLPDRCSDGDQNADPPLPSSPLAVERIPDWPPLVLLLTVLLLLLLLLVALLLLLSDINLLRELVWFAVPVVLDERLLAKCY